MSENPNIGLVSVMELTVAEFHQRRRHLADSLRFLLEAAESAEGSNAPQMYSRIDNFIRSELIPGGPGSGGDTSLASKIFKEVENIGNVMARADAARRNARTNSVAPSAQGKPDLPLLLLRY
jgi:nuclear pore complex protein Nup205